MLGEKPPGKQTLQGIQQQRKTQFKFQHKNKIVAPSHTYNDIGRTNARDQMKIIVGNSIQTTWVHTLRSGKCYFYWHTKFRMINFENTTNGQVRISMAELKKKIKTGSYVSDEAMYEHEVQAIQCTITSHDEQDSDATQESYYSVGATKN